MIGRVLKRGSNVAAGCCTTCTGRARPASTSTRTWWPGGGTRPSSSRRCGRTAQRDFRRLTGLMEIPLAVLGRPRPGQAGVALRGPRRARRPGPGRRRVDADRRGDHAPHRPVPPRRGRTRACRGSRCTTASNHIHIVAVLARQDGRRARLHNDYYRIGEALRDIEAEYGLRGGGPGRPDRAAAADPGRAGEGGPGRAGRAAPGHAAPPGRRPPRPAARSEPEFFAALAAAGCGSGCGTATRAARRGDRVRGRPAPATSPRPGQQVWFGGGKLAPDLTLPKLRRRWPSRPPGQRRGAGAAVGCTGAG